MALVTVTGAGGSTLSLTMTSAANALIAQQLLDGVSAGVEAGTITAYSYGGSGPLIPPSGASMLVLTGPGAVTIPASTATVVDVSGIHHAIIGGDATEQFLVTGRTGITYFANTGSGTVIAGGGDNTIVIGGKSHGRDDDDDSRMVGYFSGDRDGSRWKADHDGHEDVDEHGNHTVPAIGNHVVLTGGQSDRIYALAGDVTIGAGGGNNTIVLGTGTARVDVTGTDRIQAGAGSATIDATGGQAIVTGERGAISFIGGAMASTVFGASGAVTATGGSGGGWFKGGSDGNNLLTAGAGAVTLFGAATGDRLTGGAAADVLVAGTGNETLTGGGDIDEFTIIRGLVGHNLITDFTLGTDRLVLSAFNSNEFANDLVNAHVVAGGVSITLSDNTVLTFANLSVSDLSSITVSNSSGH
jgi:Ca2+-binding RTX toxin-like protein